MSNVAPGVYTSVVAASPSPNGNVPTGTWFVTGETAQGPTGVAIPVTSMNDYVSFLGTRVSYGYLYDSLTEFFHDGGILAYVSRIVGASAGSAAVTLSDRAGSPLPTLGVKAAGAGAWGNTLSIKVANGTASNSYTLQVLNAAKVVASSTNLFTPQDAVNWASSLNPWVVQVLITNKGSTTAPPNNIPATGTFSLTGGSDDYTTVTETSWTNALAVFTETYGPGQVSAPGHTTTAGYEALANHALNNNRVALLDDVDTSAASAIVTQAQTIQAAASDPSYGALFAPWVVIPGIFSTNPGSKSPVPTRVVPPSSLVAALMARNDQNNTNTANTPAAGSNGVSTYATGVTQQYAQSTLGLLNAAGVDVIRVINSGVTLYGYRSLATDPNWVYLNNVRFRMQMIYDFDLVGENFVFDQIDGRGQLFARFNGALAGQCQTYYTDNALYGATAADAFSVNTGPQVNTPTTIQAGQLNAQIGVVMSPFAETVYIFVSKYLLSQGLPNS